MSKRFTKIICASIAAVSAFTLVFASACSKKWSGVDGDKDTATQAVAGTNGGFVTETADYVYFINGKAANTDANKFGTVLKGSVQRIKRSDLNARNYANTQTVVPSVIYSGSYNAGLYIYDGYLYYTSPTTQKNADGEVLNSNLDFKRTKLDGTDTSDYIWQSSDNAVDYRFVSVDGNVYILYALSENLYGTSATNIHSVDCSTGENRLIAYNVASYAFDTENVENPYVYYTMSVPQYFGGSNTYDYNQLYRVRADVKESPRAYNFDDVKDYDAEKDPVYVNYGDYVFDGIGKLNYQTEGRVTQLNYAHYSGRLYGTANAYNLTNDDFTYSIRNYKDGVLYYTRQSKDSSYTGLYTLADGDITSDWDAVEKNFAYSPLIRGADTTQYEFVKMGEETYALNMSADGITKSLVADGKVGDALTVTSAASATVLAIREEGGHTNVYYSVSGGNGYTVNRIAVDGTEDDYRKLSTTLEPDLTYRSIKILDLDASSSWYKPEFVSGSNKLMFASETEGMSSYNYVMICDLDGANGVMTNKEIDELNKKFESVTEKIEAYDEKTNPDGSKAYDGLANALKYQFYTGDSDYVDELVKAYVEVLGKDEEYAYSKDTVALCKAFAAADGDWESYKEGDEVKYNYKTDVKTINGEEVHSNSREYYYSVIGRMTDDDIKGFKDGLKTTYMKEYPVDNTTWWEGLSSGAKAGFIIGMVAIGLIVIAGVTVLTVWLVRRKKRAVEDGNERKVNVDITDDKDVDVYGEGGESGEDNDKQE